MSTPSFGQPSPFGAVPDPSPALPTEPEEPTGSRKTAVLAVAAGVVALGVLGGAAVLVLGSGPDGTAPGLPPAAVGPAQPSVAPSAPSTLLPTFAVQARNVFAPLVDPDLDGTTGDAAGGTTEGGTTEGGTTSSGGAATPVPLPTAGSTAAPLTPLPQVVRTVTVPGPTVAGPVVTEQVPGPTVTVPGPVETVDRFAYAVEVVSVSDPDPEVEDDSTAVFRINGTEVSVLEGEEFLEVFQYLGYEPGEPAGTDPTTEPEGPPTVTFAFGSSLWSVVTGLRYGLGPR